MPYRWTLLCLLAVLFPLVGCQHKRLPQTHVIEVWEFGQPVSINYGYYKGVWVYRYDQITFFDQHDYHCRATTVVAQGFSMDWDTRAIKGKWKRDADGMPMLRQNDGTYQRLDAVYPAPDPDLDPIVHHPGGPSVFNRLTRTYAAQPPASRLIPTPEQINDSPLKPDDRQEQGELVAEPSEDAAAPTPRLPIEPYTTGE